MADLDPVEIYVVARNAGFSPDQAVTMTAIALAESGGRTDAHASQGESSWGLWQINLAVHQGSLGRLGDPTDPLVNARMAYEVSGHGTDIGRWTTTHGDKGARYLDFRSEAEAAAHQAEPAVTAHGVWDPPDDYHSPRVSAGAAGISPPPPALPHDLRGDGDAFVWAAASQAGNVFIDRAMAQQGDRYVFGHEADTGDADPDTFDCSELVQWAAAQAGVEVSDGSWLQYQQAHRAGGELTVDEALHTPGALLFRFSSDPNGSGRPDEAHVAISLGDGRTIEARGRAYGVGVFDAEGRGWTHAAAFAELTAATAAPVVVPPLPPLDPGADSDGDGILDPFEVAIGTNPYDADTDRDGFVDSAELLDFGTDPLDAADNARNQALVAAGLAPTLSPVTGGGLGTHAGYVTPDDNLHQLVPGADTGTGGQSGGSRTHHPGAGSGRGDGTGDADRPSGTDGRAPDDHARPGADQPADSRHDADLDGADLDDPDLDGADLDDPDLDDADLDDDADLAVNGGSSAHDDGPDEDVGAGAPGGTGSAGMAGGYSVPPPLPPTVSGAGGGGGGPSLVDPDDSDRDDMIGRPPPWVTGAEDPLVDDGPRHLDRDDDDPGDLLS